MRKLKADEIECRIAQVTAKGCSLLLYKTARVDRAILDEEFGAMNWQNDFKVIDGKMYGGIGISRNNNGNTEWIWKWDCGTESQTEQEKGQASDAFKRAGFKWGIGIELYTAPFIWYNCPTHQNSKGKYELDDKYIKFAVKDINYAENGDINKLVIIDDKNNLVYSLGSKEKPKPKETKKEDKSAGFEGVTNEDSGLYIALAKMKDIDEIKSYYEANKEYAVNREKFHEACCSKIKAVKEIIEEFGEDALKETTPIKELASGGICG